MSAWHHFLFYHVLLLKVKAQGLKRSGSLWRLSKVVKAGSSSSTPRSHDYYLHTFPAWMNFLPLWIMWSMSVDELHLVQVPEYFFLKRNNKIKKNKTKQKLLWCLWFSRVNDLKSLIALVSLWNHTDALLAAVMSEMSVWFRPIWVSCCMRQTQFSKSRRQNRKRLRNSHIIFLRCSGYLLIRRSTPHSSFHIMVSAWFKQID